MNKGIIKGFLKFLKRKISSVKSVDYLGSPTLASSIIVHPILKEVTRPAAVEVFKPFFHKTHNSMIVMSIIVTVLALAISYFTGNWWWFGISLLMHLNGPYTLKFMMPTNNRLMADDVDPHSEQSKADLLNWGNLHAVRTVWNGLIFIGFLVLLGCRLNFSDLIS